MTAPSMDAIQIALQEPTTTSLTGTANGLLIALGYILVALDSAGAVGARY